MHETGQIPDLTTLSDRLAIYDVLVRHSRGADRGDAAVLTSAYWPDAEVAYGAFNGSAHVFCERLPRAMRVFQWTHHAIGNVSIEIDRLARGTRDLTDPVYLHLGG